MINEEALNLAHEAMSGFPVTGKQNCLRVLSIGMEVYLSALPKPESPYEQAMAYRKLVGTE